MQGNCTPMACYSHWIPVCRCQEVLRSCHQKGGAQRSQLAFSAGDLRFGLTVPLASTTTDRASGKHLIYPCQDLESSGPKSFVVRGPC